MPRRSTTSTIPLRISNKTPRPSFACRLLVSIMVLSLLCATTPAAPRTIVETTSQLEADISFWLRANYIGTKLWNFFLAPAHKAQETQAQRNARVARIQIFPGDLTLEEGEEVNLATVAYDAEENSVSGVQITWSAHDEDRNRDAGINPRGQFKARAPGNYRLIAEGAGKSASIKIKVLKGKPHRKDEQPTEIRTVSTRDLPPEAIAKQPQTPAPAVGTMSKRSSEKTATAKLAHAKPPATAPYFISNGWDSTNYWSADDPENRRGAPPGAPLDGGAGSGNFNFAVPALTLPGRGLDVSLGLSYNSRLWNKASSNINFDIDHDWPAPGFSLGFGKLLGMTIPTGCMIVDADGTRHSYSGTITFYSWGTVGVMHTTDGSLIDYTYQTGTNGVITWAQAKMPNGTVINYGAYSQPGGGVFPTFIEDANGNYINITYVNNQGPRIQTVSDTLGRTTTFHYDSLNRLTALTAPGLSGATRTVMRLHYSQLSLSYSFSGLTANVRDSFPYVIDAIYFPGTATGYWFSQSDNSYSTYGMLKKVSERRGMTFSGSDPVPPGQGYTDQGTITAGSITKEETYNYPLNTSDTTGTQASNLTDAPTYTSCVESWTRDGTNFDSATTLYDVHQNTTPRTVTVTMPNGATNTQTSYNSAGSYLDGLVYLDETKSGSTVLQSSSTQWDPGAYGSARPASITVTNERGNSTQTLFTYGSVYNQVTDVRLYDYANSLLRSSRTTYQNSATYTNFHIFNLPLVVEIYAGDNVTRVSRTEYQYDSQTMSATPNVVQHDQAYNPYADAEGYCWWEPDYNDPDCTGNCYDYSCDGYCGQNYVCPYWGTTDYRGNITQVNRYADAAAMTGAVVETRRYDVTGNVVTTSTSCCEQTSYGFSLSSQYAYPLSTKRGSATDALQQISTSATVDFNTGLTLTSTDANGRISQTTYDPATLRPQTAARATGAHTDFVYDDANLSTTQTTYLETHPTHATITNQNTKLLNGRGQVRREMALGVNSVWDYVDTVYDNMGRASQQTRPYRSGDTLQWTTMNYDLLSRVTSTQLPDGSTAQSFYNETARPSAASSSAGETVRTIDAWGRENWSRADSQGRLVEVVEPDPEGNGSVTSNGMVTTYSYDTVGNLVGTTQGPQTRSFKYDSLKRLKAQKLAEASATLNDSGVYVGSGTWSDVFTYDNRSNVTSHTDARGVKTVYTYNSDPLNRLQSVSWDTTGFGDTAYPIVSAPTISYSYRTKSTGTDAKDIAQIASVTTSGVSTESYSFDSEGRISSRTLTLTSRSGFPFVSTYIYDALDRPVELQYPAEYGNGSQPRKQVHQYFDIASRLNSLTVDGQNHAANVTYDPSSQVTSLNVGLSGANQITENYAYNAQTGQLENQTVVRGGSTTLLNLGYGYAGTNGKRTGQLVSISNNLDHTKDHGYEYDALGRLRRATGGQNVNWVQRYNYDRYGNRNNVFSHTADFYIRNFYQSALARQPNSTELNSWLSTLQSAYAQGPSQFLSAMQSLGASLFTSAEYASRGRNDHWYVYDLYHAYLFRDPDSGGWTNWENTCATSGRNAARAGFDWSIEFNLHVTGTSPYSPPGGATVPNDGWGSLGYDTANNHVAVSGWYYDAAGNQTRVQNGATWNRYQYDAANRLVYVRADDNSTVLANYTYGSSGHRLIGNESNTRTYYAFEGDSVLAEYTETGGSTSPGWSKSYIYFNGRLLSTLAPNGSGGESVSYHHPDRLGTRLISNGQNTTYIEQATLPFGTSLPTETTDATNNRRFTSYHRSVATGLDYAINRHYDSQQGRFTQVDPMGMSAASLMDPQSLNMYSYVGNDPVNRTDPSGLFWGKLWRAIKKILTNKWVMLALTIAVAVLTIGSAAGWWSLTKTIFADLGPSGIGNAHILIPVGTAATKVGWLTSALQTALQVTNIGFSARQILKNIAYVAASTTVSFALSRIAIGQIGPGGTPGFNPDAGLGFQGNAGMANAFDPKRDGLSDCVKKLLSAWFSEIDLNKIRIHRSMPRYVRGDADAYTEGNNIFFRNLDQRTSAGIALIGHELTHVRQEIRFGSLRFVRYYLQNSYREWRAGRDPAGYGNPLEKEAYDMQGAIKANLDQNFGGKDPCP